MAEDFSRLQDVKQPSYGLVYELLCTATNLRYVGQTTDTLDSRWRAHCDNALKRHSSVELAKAIREYGPDSFVRKVIVECCDRRELNALETKFIIELGTVWPMGYNMTHGGNGPCEVTRSKISKTLSGRQQPRELVERRRAANKGRKRDADSRERISAGVRRHNEEHGPRKIKFEHAETLHRSRRGKKHTEESRKKMSANRKGKGMSPCTEERRVKLRDALSGRVVSSLTRQRISEALRSRPKKIDGETQAQIVKARLEGEKLATLAARHGVSVSFISTLCKRVREAAEANDG